MSPPAGVVDGLLAGRYRLVARLGAGGHGEVWRARDERLERDVAVKVLRPELAGDEDVRARFRAEARSAGGLRHPGIAAVFDFAEGDDGAWLVMELVDGAPLSAVLRREGRLPVERTLDLVGQAAGALQAAHDGGVVHRDVKPGNLLLRADGRLSVTDFGIAQAAGAAALTRTGQVVGTAAYVSPEQASGRPVSGATDLYALGVVAFECLSGTRPFERDDPVAVLLAHLQAPPPPLPPDVPRPVADLVHRLLAKDPADRPTSAAQVQQEASELRQSRGTAPASTAVLPGTSAARPAEDALPGRPAVLGLAGRPGQRRAVRVTAVALGLLALALGVRDAVRQDPASPADVRPQPASSVPAAERAPGVRPQDQPAPAPQDQQQPVQEPAPQNQQQPVQEPEQQPVREPEQQPVQPQDGRQGGRGGQGPGQSRDKADEQQDEEQGKDSRQSDRGRGGDR